MRRKRGREVSAKFKLQTAKCKVERRAVSSQRLVVSGERSLWPLILVLNLGRSLAVN
jgi:hypothetical protein